MRDLAEELGYRPGEALIKRMKAARDSLDEWKTYIDNGTVPPDLGCYTIGLAIDKLKNEESDLARQELAMLEYFYPKHRSTELKGPNGGAIPVSVIERVIVDPKNPDT